jgi:hypothetical protein
MRTLIFFAIVITILGCNSNTLETSHKKSKEIDSITKRIAFDYTATRYIQIRFDSSKFPMVKVDVRLLNHNPDTVYFLSFYCYRGEELLQYDTAKFIDMPQFGCFAEVPYVEKIPPNGDFQIEGNFAYKSNETKIKFCIHFCRVDKSFKLNDSLSAREVFDLINTNGDFLCAPEKLIKNE